MNNLWSRALINALGTGIYVFLVALVMRYGERLFGETDNLGAPIAVLLLLVLSAAVTGSLVLGKPVLMYWDGRKAEAVKMFIYTLVWLFVFTVATFTVQLFV